MHVRDWKRFIEEGHGKEIEIAQIPAFLNGFLGGASRNLILHHDYAVKAVRKHEMLPEHFPMIFETVDRGYAIHDRERHLTFFYLDEIEFDQWFQVTIKRCTERRRLFVCTFYNKHDKEVARVLKKHEIIWPIRHPK